MRLSGFSFARNAVELGYPIRESLASLLPVVDELVVAVAPGDDGDETVHEIEALGDARVRIVEAPWDPRRRHLAYADATNAALRACSGDWCLYLQADEVLHEDDQDLVRDRCEALLGDHRVEGLLFDYLHFFGDYGHVQRGQGWYGREIRLIRNGIGVESVRDAQSFRRPGQRRLTVARSGARVFHYGWVRPPELMQRKFREFWSHRVDPAELAARAGAGETFDYGPLGRLTRWDGVHPRVMHARIAEMDWANELREEDLPGRGPRRLHRDERLLYRLLSAVSRLTGIDLNHSNHGRVLDV